MHPSGNSRHRCALPGAIQHEEDHCVCAREAKHAREASRAQTLKPWGGPETPNHQPHHNHRGGGGNVPGLRTRMQNAPLWTSKCDRFAYTYAKFSPYGPQMCPVCVHVCKMLPYGPQDVPGLRTRMQNAVGLKPPTPRRTIPWGGAGGGA